MEVNSEKCFVELMRVSGGILVHARMTPELEEFFKNLGSGETHPPEAYNGFGSVKWRPGAGKPLEIWAINNENAEALSMGQKFRLDTVNQPLEVDASLGYVSNVNLSFLRMKGISSPEGIKFVVAGGVVSKSGLYDLRDKIVRHVKFLYAEFIRPTKAVGIVYETITQEG